MLLLPKVLLELTSAAPGIAMNCFSRGSAIACAITSGVIPGYIHCSNGRIGHVRQITDGQPQISQNACKENRHHQKRGHYRTFDKRADKFISFSKHRIAMV